MKLPFTHLIPYDPEKNLAEAYNAAIDQIPCADWILLTDADVMFLTPDYGHLIAEVIERNPAAGLITCLTNRIGSQAQLTDAGLMKEANLLELRKIALSKRKEFGAKVVPVHPPCSGMFMLFRRETWVKVGRFKGRGMLGVDDQFSADVHSAGFPILRMEGLFVAHFYRLDTGHHDTSHLK